MLQVIAKNHILPEYIDEIMPLYRKFVEKTKKESLCVSYALFINQKDPGHLILI